MGDYDTDILPWSERQADLLRRMARGERVNGLDFDRVAEEIEDLGLSQLNGVRSHLRLLLVHLLKLYGWPDSPSANHWLGKAVSFQAGAQDRFAPLMGQKLDIEAIYRKALEQVTLLRIDNIEPTAPWPSSCPFSLDDLLRKPVAELGASIRGPAC